MNHNANDKCYACDMHDYEKFCYFRQLMYKENNFRFDWRRVFVKEFELITIEICYKESAMNGVWIVDLNECDLIEIRLNETFFLWIY